MLYHQSTPAQSIHRMASRVDKPKLRHEPRRYQVILMFTDSNKLPAMRVDDGMRFTFRSVVRFESKIYFGFDFEQIENNIVFYIRNTVRNEKKTKQYHDVVRRAILTLNESPRKTNAPSALRPVACVRFFSLGGRRLKRDVGRNSVSPTGDGPVPKCHKRFRKTVFIRCTRQ